MDRARDLHDGAAAAERNAPAIGSGGVSRRARFSTCAARAATGGGQDGPAATPETPATPEAANDASESPLMNFLRRAVNTPPAVEAQEPTKP